MDQISNDALVCKEKKQPAVDSAKGMVVRDGTSSSKQHNNDKPDHKRPRKLTPKEKKATTIATYEVLNPTDVLLGRGKRASLWQGNLRYKKIIYSFLPAYEAATKNAEKTGITGEIVAAVKRSGGRFLKENARTGELSEVSDFTARLKVGQAMRHRRRLRETGEVDSDEELMASLDSAKSPADEDSIVPSNGPAVQDEPRSNELPEIKPRPADSLMSPEVVTSTSTGRGAGVLPCVPLAETPGRRREPPADVGNLDVLIEALKREESSFGRSIGTQSEESRSEPPMPSSPLVPFTGKRKSKKQKSPPAPR
ncbi:hypothetical protein ACA910_004168, partial [Epithemia clementina (nom. ined.)]